VRSEEQFRHEGVALAATALPPALTGTLAVINEMPPPGLIAAGGFGTAVGISLAIAYLLQIKNKS
jgi:hypothetical protein